MSQSTHVIGEPRIAPSPPSALALDEGSALTNADEQDGNGGYILLWVLGGVLGAILLIGGVMRAWSMSQRREQAGKASGLKYVTEAGEASVGSACGERAVLAAHGAPEVAAAAMGAGAASVLAVAPRATPTAEGLTTASGLGDVIVDVAAVGGDEQVQEQGYGLGVDGADEAVDEMPVADDEAICAAQSSYIVSVPAYQWLERAEEELMGDLSEDDSVDTASPEVERERASVRSAMPWTPAAAPRGEVVATPEAVQKRRRMVRRFLGEARLHV